MTERERKPSRKAAIQRLEDHPEPYVAVSDLATYWGVSRKQIYKQIDTGTLTAVRFGPRLLRIRTSEALRFERDAKMSAVARTDGPARLQNIPIQPVKAGVSPVASADRHVAHLRVRPRG